MTDDEQNQAQQSRAAITAEMTRTAFQRKAVSRRPVSETLNDAIAYFKERGYRSGRTGRPNQIFVMGGREGILPRVNAEILAQGNVGKAKVTMLTISGFGLSSAAISRITSLIFVSKGVALRFQIDNQGVIENNLRSPARVELRCTLVGLPAVHSP